MPALVHRAEERRVDKVLVIPCGDANVGDAGVAGERMHGRVEPPRIRTKTEILDDVERELALPVDRKFSVQALVANDIDAFTNLGDERNQIFFQRVENRFDFRRLHPALKIIEQGIVDVIVRRETLGVATL